MKRLINCSMVLLIIFFAFISLSGCTYSKRNADDYSVVSDEEEENDQEKHDNALRQKCSKDEIVDYFIENRTKFNDLLNFFVNQNWTSVYIAEENGIKIDHRLATDEEQSTIEECLNGWHVFDVFSSIYYQCQEGMMCRFEFKCGVSQGVCVDLTEFAPLSFEEAIEDNWYYYDYPIH